MVEPTYPLERRGDRPAPLLFRQGAHAPFGIRWYGVTSLFGHLRNFVSRFIALESVDTRDWMRPNAPEELLAGASRTLGGAEGAGSLVEALGRPVWIDFVADTGDDRDVSAGVGRMLAAAYELDGRSLPRGDLLVFGGDIAYPVATADEVQRRLVEPWNEQLRKIGASSRKRVLLGVPGNHDWYDGLDGFGRLFRRPDEAPFRADTKSPKRLRNRLARRTGRKVGLVARQLHLDEVSGLVDIAVGVSKTAVAFAKGEGVKRRRRLVLRGYEPVQEASYFAMRIAPGLDLWGADRQLGSIDFRQREFFRRRFREDPHDGLIFVSADPAMVYGLDNPPGSRMLDACDLSLQDDHILYLSGDFHHYERRAIGESVHVIAGGGGAFLHGTRMTPYPAPIGPPACVYPTGAMSRKLVLGVPLRLMMGRAGLLIHASAALFASIELGAAHEGPRALVAAASIVAVAVTTILYFAAHQGVDKRKIGLIAAPFGAAIGFAPMGLRLALPAVGPALAGDTAVLVACAFLTALLFGAYFTVLTLLGLEHQQAFTVLGHPGYKHFVRLCVHPDGRVEAWTIGKDDVLDPSPAALIDTFEWGPAPSPPPPSVIPSEGG